MSTPSRIFTITSRSLAIAAKLGARSYCVPGSSDDCSNGRGGSAVTTPSPARLRFLLLRAAPGKYEPHVYGAAAGRSSDTPAAAKHNGGAEHGLKIDAPDRDRP